MVTVARPHTVLVVDDSDDIREAFGIMLTLQGCAVAGAAGVRTALRLLRDGFDPCVVLLDLHMPELDGWHFLDERDRDRSLGEAAVIVVSGDAEQRTRVIDRGCDFLLKPARIDAVLARITRACGRHGGDRPVPRAATDPGRETAGGRARVDVATVPERPRRRPVAPAAGVHAALKNRLRDGG